jgi:hypothetical protein
MSKEEVNAHLASQEIPPPFKEPLKFNTVFKEPSLVPIISQANLAHRLLLEALL